MLPDNALLIFEVEGEEDFNRWHREMSLRNIEAAQPVAYVRLTKWRMHSSIEAMTLVGAGSEKGNATHAKR